MMMGTDLISDRNIKIYHKDSDNNIERKYDLKLLKDIHQEYQYFFLLGNAGIGKTTELQLLSKELEINEIVNVKNFRVNYKLEDFIHSDKKDTLLIDGLDEVKDIEDFISEIENFIIRNHTVKIIISCRTNIYEKFKINIDDFGYGFLEKLTDQQISQIILKKLGFEIPYYEIDTHNLYLSIPFHLNLFIDFYRSNNRFPEYPSEIWNNNINEELNKLSKKVLQKRYGPINNEHIKKLLSRIGFINEMTNEKIISSDNLYTLIGQDNIHIIEELSFVEILPISNDFSFIHKNYQEYFAAYYLSKLDYDILIQFIKINDEINITKPQLHNTIGYLLNLLEEDLFAKITEWFITNQTEILFLIEREAFDEKTRNEIFRKYFEDICIVKNQWIDQSQVISIDKIAKYADIDYLLGVIDSEKYHSRIKKSAFKVLNYIKDLKHNDKIEKFLLNYILSDNVHSLDAFYVYRFNEYYKSYLTDFIKIVEFHKLSLSPDICHLIVDIFSELKNCEDYFNDLLHYFKRIYSVDRILLEDNVSRLTGYKFEKIIDNISNTENFIEILNILFNRKYYLEIEVYRKDQLEQKLINKTIDIFRADEDIIYRIINAFIRNPLNYFYKDDTYIGKLIQLPEIKNKLFIYVINQYGINENNYILLAKLFNEENLEYFLNKYDNKLKINDKIQIQHLRNHLCGIDRKLAIEFEDQMIKRKFSFSDKIIDDKRDDNYQKFLIENIEILFDKKLLVNKINILFKELDVSEIDLVELSNINRDWYRTTGYHGHINHLHNIIRFFSSKESTSISLKYLIDSIKTNEYYQIKFIYDLIKRHQFQFNEKQIYFIKEQCITISQLGDKTLNHLLLEMDEKFDIRYSEEFYLNTIAQTLPKNIDLEFIKNRINNDTIFEQQIIKILKLKKDIYGVTKYLIEYCIENKIKDSYHLIADIYFSDKYSLPIYSTFKSYLKLLDQKELDQVLNLFLEDIEHPVCWYSIRFVIEENITKYNINSIAHQYLETVQHKNRFIADSISILFYTNDTHALPIYYNTLKQFSEQPNVDLSDDMYIHYIESYTDITHIQLIKDLFELIYTNTNSDTFDFHKSKNVFTDLISTFSKNKDGFEQIQSIFNILKEKFISNQTVLFYINNILIQSKNIYYTTKSKTYTFNQIKNFILNLEKQPNIIMGDNYNNNFTNTNNSIIQIGGKKNTLNIHQNSNLQEIQDLIVELRDIEAFNTEWRNLLIEGLVELKEAEHNPQEIKKDGPLKKLSNKFEAIGNNFDTMKKYLEFPDLLDEKIPRIIELGEKLIQLFS